MTRTGTPDSISSPDSTILDLNTVMCGGPSRRRAMRRNRCLNTMRLLAFTAAIPAETSHRQPGAAT